LKLFQEWGEGGIKENDGGGELTVKNWKKFCKCHNVPSTTIKIIKKTGSYVCIFLHKHTYRRVTVNIVGDV
jgi:hypothetical protein